MRRIHPIVGTVLVLAGVALILWFRISPGPSLPFPFSQLSPTWPGESNYWRDDLRLLGNHAVPPLLTQLKRRSFGELTMVRSLRRNLPPSLAKFVPDVGQAHYSRAVVLWALGEIGPAASNATPDLIHFRDRTSEADERAAATIALAKIHPTDMAARSNFLALLSSSQQTERFYAAQEFGAVPMASPEDLTPLIKALGDPDGEVRANAAFSLSRFGRWGEPAVPVLKSLLIDTYRHVPLTAAVALAAISPEHVPIALPVITNAVDRKADLSELVAPTFFRVAGTSAVAAIPWLSSLMPENPNGNRGGPYWVALALCQVSPDPPASAIDQVAKLDFLNLASVATLKHLGSSARNAVPKLLEFERITISPTARAAIQAALVQITNSASLRGTNGLPPDPNG
ncbi:MAG TPA: HEAT repeat domain-containing protein [Verrucomicrobiota bacterium]|nr:HEAT repeat domain-containing protein [Verrucomicrobiota bacterium]